MKRHLIIIDLALTAMLASCGSSKEFSRLGGLDGVDVVHIPQGMMAMAKTAGLTSGDKELRRVVNGVKSLDVVSCDNRRSREEVMKCALEAISDSKSELLIEVAEKNERTAIYGRCDEGSDKVADVVIVAESAGDLSVIRAKGKFDITDLLNSDSSGIKFFSH